MQVLLTIIWNFISQKYKVYESNNNGVLAIFTKDSSHWISLKVGLKNISVEYFCMLYAHDRFISCLGILSLWKKSAKILSTRWLMMQTLPPRTTNKMARACLTLSGIVIQIWPLALSGVIFIVMLVCVGELDSTEWKDIGLEIHVKPHFQPGMPREFFETFRMF